MKRQLVVVYCAFRHPRLQALPKLIIALCVAYALSPIDLIPDFIPVLGYLDDLFIIPALIALALRLIPKDILQEAKARAETDNLVLKKNWAFALVFISIWLILAFITVKALIR